MTVYRLSGLTITTNLPLDDYARRTSAGNDEPTVTVTVEDEAPPKSVAGLETVNEHQIEDTPYLTVYRANERYRLRAHDYADFVVEPHRGRVRILPFPARPLEAIAQLFVDCVVPNLASGAGAPAFHGSAVAYQNEAVVFLGDPGLGKSTLASSLCPPARWLGDDCVAVQLAGGTAMVQPSYPFARLYGEALDGIGRTSTQRASSRNDKWRLQQAVVDVAVPMSAAFVLGDDAEEVTMARLSLRDAVTAFARHMFRLDPSDRRALVAELDTLQRLAEAVPVHRMSYPRRFANLREVAEAIRQRLR